MRKDKHRLNKVLVSPSLDLTFLVIDSEGDMRKIEQMNHSDKQTPFNLTQMTSL